MRKITLEGLEVLDAIDRKGSFAAAAASLHRVPSKVTYTVNKLQEDLGVTLFRREGRRSVLTPAGRLLLEEGRQLLQVTDHLVEKTRQLDRGWETHLRIILDTVLELDVLAPYLAAFCEQQPETEVEIMTGALGGTWEAVLEERADLAVGALDESPDPSIIESRPLMAMPMVFAVAPEHPLAMLPGPISESERLRHRAVVVRNTSRVRPALSRRVTERQQCLSVASLEQKIAAQSAGLGAGFLPRHRAEPLLSSGDLVELELEKPAPDSSLFLAWRSDSRGRALRWFVDRLSELAEPPAEQLPEEQRPVAPL